jgi:hypothetical protein
MASWRIVPRLRFGALAAQRINNLQDDARRAQAANNLKRYGKTLPPSPAKTRKPRRTGAF